MNSRNIKNGVLNLVSQRLKPTQETLSFKTSGCPTCIQKNDNHRAHHHCPTVHKNTVHKKNNINSLVYSVKVLPSPHYNYKKDFMDPQKQQKPSKDDAYDHMSKITQWIQNLLEYMWSDGSCKLKIMKQYLPHGQNQEMISLRMKTYDTIDLMNDKRIQLNKKSNSSFHKRINSSQIIQPFHSTDAKYFCPDDNPTHNDDKNKEKGEDLLRFLYMQAVSIENQIQQRNEEKIRKRWKI